MVYENLRKMKGWNRVGDNKKMKKGISYKLALLLLSAIVVTGCANAQGADDTTEEESQQVAMADVLPKAGEAAGEVVKEASTEKTAEVTEEAESAETEEAEVAEIAKVEETTETSKKNNKKATKGTIKVATVGSPNEEILQKAAGLLEEKGYQLTIEVCDEYLTPNQMLVEGQVDCNYYQHKAFLDRYNIEHQTTLAEVAKIHYEPLVIYSEKLESLDQVEKGMKVAISNNPTATARALWLLQDVELLTLMSDADMNTVKDDIAENPYNLEFVFVEESELVGKLQDIDLVICDKDLLMQEAMDDRDLFLAQEKEETMMVQNLSQVIAAVEAENANAKILAEVLLSEEMKQFVTTKYQGCICIMTSDVKEEIVDTDKDE